ncbi:1-deoxy-D-xylulose-5-phosphate synthase [Streptomyces sp. 4F14]|uniref:1-deoxy-D-xylulose-5-phosphate synthase n=1 Tax=Streptomyces sp. 4F14 TaxID=3394380 RepID=UPI003A856D15
MASPSMTPVADEGADRFPDLAGLRSLPVPQLSRLAADIRSFLVDSVCATGGHLGPNPGVVELALALHRVFDSPRDTLVFDTGHQAYVHKLLTGRSAGFATLRQPGGLSGCPSRAESAHDVVENSHASTALSYADGLAKARQLSGEQDRSVVAVIGDGAMTGGMAREALNNLGAVRDRPVVVVLNDNGRSYEPTHGALARHLDVLRSGAAGRNLFTDLGFAYVGPVDGHRTGEIEGALRRARHLGRPVVVHVVTVKGKGYEPAERDEADCLHAVGGQGAGSSGPSWTNVFARTLAELAAERPEMVAVTAAMPRPTGPHVMRQAFPDRVFDVGIAEQHAVTSAAGLATGGLRPVVAVHATFLGRAFDQVLMDVALHRLPVTFVLDRAGITGPDGPGHHGMWDLSLLAAVPGMRVAAPRDTERLGFLLREAAALDAGPTALRIPKATAGPPVTALARMDGVDILHRSRHRGPDVLLVPVGPLAEAAVGAARVLESEGIGSTVADPRWVLPANPTLAVPAGRHRLAASPPAGWGGFSPSCAGPGTPAPPSCRWACRARSSRTVRAPALLAQAGLDQRGIADAVRTGLPGHRGVTR